MIRHVSSSRSVATTNRIEPRAIPIIWILSSPEPRSGSISSNRIGSSMAAMASKKSTRCLRRFAAALLRSHRSSRGGGPASLSVADRAPEALGAGRHRQVADAEQLQRVDEGVADRRHRADRAGFARALDAERVSPGRHRAGFAMDVRQIVGARHRVIHEGTGDELAGGWVEMDVLQQDLPGSLGDAAADLALEQ